jgi:DNA-binding transcriptional LysR family regulator
MPTVVAKLQAQAPNLLLDIRGLPTDVAEQLDSGRADFLIANIDQAPERFARERLILEKLAWVVRAGHPLSRAPASLDDLVGVRHVLVAGRRESADRSGINFRSPWEDLSAFDSELARRGLSRKVAVVAPDAFSAMAMVVNSDMAALVPRRLATMSAQRGRLAIIEPPYEAPSVEFVLLYRRDRLAEPSLAWMRGVLADAAAAL